MTKVLMISTDTKILEEGSDVRARMLDYGSLFDELHIIVLAKNGFQFPVPEIEIANNITAYPTRSLSKLLYIVDAVRIGSRIVGSWDATKSVITTQDPFETGLAGKRLSQKFHIPLHVQIHTDMFSPYFVRSHALNILRMFVSKAVIAHASSIRTVSERIKRSLRDPRASILPIYTDITAIRQSPVPVGFKKDRVRFDKTVLMASRFTKEKDLPTALRAFARVAKRQTGVGLMMIGAGNSDARIKALASKLGIGDRVEVLSWMDRGEAISYMKICDVFLSSSLYEGYGLSMLEAHSCGATLAVTDAGIAPLLANDKCLALPQDEKGLEQAISNALSGSFKNKEYSYPYQSKDEYLSAFKKDIERTIGL
jgi:glycosyltransferase involved in cell wall biosynthesis